MDSCIYKTFLTYLFVSNFLFIRSVILVQNDVHKLQDVTESVDKTYSNQDNSTKRNPVTSSNDNESTFQQKFIIQSKNKKEVKKSLEYTDTRISNGLIFSTENSLQQFESTEANQNVFHNIFKKNTRKPSVNLSIYKFINMFKTTTTNKPKFHKNKTRTAMHTTKFNLSKTKTITLTTKPNLHRNKKTTIKSITTPNFNKYTKINIYSNGSIFNVNNTRRPIMMSTISSLVPTSTPSTDNKENVQVTTKATQKPIIKDFLGGACNNSNKCSGIKNSICFWSICNCRSNYMANINRDECLPVRTTIGEECQESIQCKDIVNSVCNRDRCRCKFGYKMDISQELCIDYRRNVYPIEKHKQNFLWIAVWSIVVIIFIALLLFLSVVLKSKLRDLRENGRIVSGIRRSTDEQEPYILSRENTSELSLEIDKPPTYEEAINYSRSVVNLAYQDTESPPTYVHVQQESSNSHRLLM